MEQLSAGVYRAKVTAVDLRFTSTGKEMVVVTFEDLDSGLPVEWVGFFTEKTSERSLETLRLLGFDDDFENLDVMAGHEAQIVVEEEEYKGRIRPRVRWVNDVNAVARPDSGMAPEARRALAARLGIAPKGERLPF